ncbi:MAG: Xaa-Pro peptidase family protein [Thermoflexales bacterium]
MLTETGCRARQQRLSDLLIRINADAAVITDPNEIYYFSGVLLPVQPFAHPGFFWLDAQGQSRLVAPGSHGGGFVAERLSYDPQEDATVNPDNARRLNLLVERLLSGVQTPRVAYQAEVMTKALGDVIVGVTGADSWIAIDGELRRMEQRKDPDEIALLRIATRVNLAGYAAGQAAIAPGVNELEVLAASQRAAELAAGQPVYLGGDFRSGEIGGPARNRPIQPGELYIVDAQTCVAGYWSDLSRAWIVGDEIAPLQQSIYDHIAAVHKHVPTLLKAGADGRDVWRETDRLIREHPALAKAGLIHHAGHNIGLRAHELPDLNRDRGGMLEVGNVLTFEPGGYPVEARHGVRLENIYLITETGPENLSEFPMALQ